MVRAALLLCLLSTNTGASRISDVFARNAPANRILLKEAGLGPPRKPGYDHPLTAESSALLDTTGMYDNIPLHATGIKCEGSKYWETGIRWTTAAYPMAFVGQGTNGKIIQVFASNTNNSKQYAVKMPNFGNQTSAQHIDKEAAIMRATTALFQTGYQPECQHVAPVFDSRPCLDGFLIFSGAYVTLRMEMDLQKWYVDYALGDRHLRKNCQVTIARQLADGLSCLHRAGSHGFMHGDFKMDNVLLTSIDPETRCPRGLRLIDFGLSHVLGSLVDKYVEKFFEGARHLPTALFEGAPDTLSLTLLSNRLKFYADSDVDWCSYVYLMNSKFHYNPIQQALPIARAVSCGKMGHGRRLVERSFRGGKDVEGGIEVQGASRDAWVAWSKALSATAAPSKRTREEAEQVERVVAQRVATPSVWDFVSRVWRIPMSA